MKIKNRSIGYKCLKIYIKKVFAEGFEPAICGLSYRGDTLPIRIIQATNDSGAQSSVEVCMLGQFQE